MAQQSSIQTLIELAEKGSDDAAKQLGRVISAHTELDKKLSLLLQYREDYVKRFQLTASKGLTAAQYTNYQQFIGKLDEAIEGQKRVVADAIGRVDTAKVNWQNEEKKRLSFDTLHQRSQLAQLNKEAKRDQKILDEQAARIHFYKR